VKKAAARANAELGALDRKRAGAIILACDELVAGRLHEQFVVDVIQGGAGTSTNMNANEVIANLALEKLGFEKGRYDVLHPNDHVNASQSTNDVYPTAVRIALWSAIDGLLDSMAILRAGFEAKAEEFKDVLKIGRTQLQDAVPMTLGQEFSTYAVMIEEDELRLREARALIQEINLGATAIGTGINAPAGYADMACQFLAQESGIPVVKSKNLVEATQDTGAFVQLSGVLKRVATKLSKTCNDLRLLSSGPQAGFGDIKLPPRQAGSSIMPGKVNPVIPELVNLVSFRVIGNDTTVTIAAHSGQLQLNAYEPVEALAIIESQHLLFNTSKVFRQKCVDGIAVNEKTLAKYMETTVGIVTALNPIIGYEKASELAAEAYKSGKGILEIVREKKILSEQQIKELLDPVKLTGLDKKAYQSRGTGGSPKE
jgi:aspartate ammonia-lyase